MKDYLRYLRGARKYMLMQHEITQGDLELILWLKPMGKFSADDLRVFEGTLSWDGKRLGTLQKKGLLVKFRNAVPGRLKALYELTTKGKAMCNLLYKILETGEFPDSPKSVHNKKSSTQAERKYGHYYRKENALRKEEAIKKGKL